MTELSPVAQEIVDAYENTTDKYAALAAVIRTVAVEVVLPKYQYADREMAYLIMGEILDIADELKVLNSNND